MSRPLGPFSVSAIGFGAMRLTGRGIFGPPRDRGEALAVLREAVGSGVDHIDTAQFYGPDVVNELLRQALYPYPDDLILVSKVGASRATGSNLERYGAMSVGAFRGNDADTSALIQATLRDVSLRGEGLGITAAEWANALLNNGLGQYQEALAAARRATENSWELGFSNWAVVELVEAAARSKMRDTAADAYRRLAEMTGASGTDWALGVEARSHALVADGEEAERLYRESIARLGPTRLQAELARAHLLYGEWLRRESRRGDAREQLRTAHELLEAMGMEAFAARARRELRATGETVRKRSVETRSELTPQEAQVAELARDGLSNPEIGARLFISARTAQYHLSKVFTKLDITSRSQLDRVLV